MAAPPVYLYKGASKRLNNRERENSWDLERLGILKPRQLGNDKPRKCGDSSVAPVRRTASMAFFTDSRLLMFPAM
jgi:hypothetical protein